MNRQPARRFSSDCFYYRWKSSSGLHALNQQDTALLCKTGGNYRLAIALSSSLRNFEAAPVDQRRTSAMTDDEITLEFTQSAHDAEQHSPTGS